MDEQLDKQENNCLANDVANENEPDKATNNDKNTTEILPKYVNLVLSGGSTRGISHIGAIKKLVEEKLLDLKKIECIACVSAGALLGVLIVLGFSIDQIWNFVFNLDFKKLIKPELLFLLEKCGMESGDTIYNLYNEILAKTTGIKNITFKELFGITKIHFIIIASNLTDKKEVHYDYINTPDFSVSLAVRISISIPCLFAPVVIDNKTYIDGGLFNNYPINLFKDKIDKTVGILIRNKYNTRYKYLEEYFVAIMNLMIHNYFRKIEQKYKNNTVYVNQIPENLSIFDFNVDNKIKIKLYKCGVVGAEKFIKKMKF
ncbi:MAG: putative patatin-like phospholipase [Satyrvirus sp.]|uniref:Putative patatin-like phospholipase n=1 Tax=Satyrvirus sp. TaxID=2487771 RepID=A0A3G5AHM1_9VIRU|nr:MAG: putative patatin-like phospholipase [Satyrvirus sp.]